MKTIEEIRKSVLTYCEEVCPFEYNKRHLGIGLLERASLDSIFYWLHVDGLSTIPIHENATDNHIFAAYRLLGLESRDAVAPYKSENERLQSAWMTEKARNTALVAAAELVIKRNWERINGDGSDYLLLSKAIGNLGDAITTNAEKGGENG